MKILERIEMVSDVIVDSFFVIDAERNIIHFNRAFHAMLPRAVARGLKGKKCFDVLQLEICSERCVAQRCWKARKHLRLDEIHGKVAKSDKDYTFTLSALPFFDEEKQPQGAMVVHRNVTDEAQVQVKYQEMLDNARHEREQLRHIVRTRTKDLLTTSQDLFRTQKELLDFKKGRLV